ncbi:MAG TPA: BadF/BadG/BcrA/BcrD ATPase family protein [Vicinamibacterales bacterium]|nr:BadF/BadG/BcrA/BcrD ATPase family protein [Vicinamibacterales bacterium]
MISRAPSYYLGIDIGSTAIKTVVVPASGGDPIWQDYTRHESRPAHKLLDVLRRVERETEAGPGNCHVFTTGSAAGAVAPLLGARHVQEVAATVIAVEKRHADARAIVELGGQDAKIVVFEEDGGRMRKIVSMNDKCAGGTGAVIDKIAAKLKIPPAALGTLSCAGRTAYPIAGKCGVFAETDINSLQKRGVPAEDLMVSLFEAIVLQNLTVLARGQTLMPRVLLLGGPHAFIAGLRDTWRAHIVRLWRERGVAVDEGAVGDLVSAPPLAAHLGAVGAIELGRLEAGVPAAYSGAARLAAALADEAQAPLRTGTTAVALSGMPMDEFRRRYDQPAWQPPPIARGSRVSGFIGLDAGSTSTKAVVLAEDGNVLAKSYQLSRGNPIEDAIDMFRALRGAIESQGASLDVRGLVTTGYAKDTLKEVFSADAALVETVAHAQSALQLYDDPHVIVDVGGQDIKIVVLRDGRVKDFRLNTQCSAGNGYFLQAIAGMFGYPVEVFAETAFSAREMPVFSYGCVLFLQSEIADVQRRGWRPEEVLAGLAAVLPKNVFLYVAKAPNLARLGRRFVLQGGTQRNLAAVKAQVDFIRENFRGQDLEPEIVLHRHAGEAGAIGAGLEAIRLWREGRATTFVGLDAAERIRFQAHSSEATRCHYCTNDCLRTFIDIWSPSAESRVGLPDRGSLGEGGQADQGPDGGVRPEPDAGHSTPPDRRLVIATCEKGAAEDLTQMRGIKAAIDAVKARTPNLVAVAAREVWKSPKAPLVSDPLPARRWSPAARRRAAEIERRGALRIGVPRVFNMYAFAPLFAGYLESLGVPAANIVYSDFTKLEMYRDGAGRGAIDPCFPSKVAVAHVHNLLVKHARRSLDVLFFPMIDVLPKRFANTMGSSACPTVALTPQTVRASFTREGDAFAERGIRYLDPLLNLEDRRLFERQMFETWEPLLALSRGENERAIAAGFEALAAYEARIRRAARAALDTLEREDRIGIVLLGRVYHHDPGLNQGIPEDLQKLGYPVFSQSTLPLDEDLLQRVFGDDLRAGSVSHPLDISDVWKNSYSESSNAKLWAAKFAARHPNLVAVELSNFKCGHDATIYATIEQIIETSGTPYFGFKDIDENRPAGAIKLRLETLDYALRRLRERLAQRRRVAERIERVLARYERRLRAGVPAARPDTLRTPPDRPADSGPSLPQIE